MKITLLLLAVLCASAALAGKRVSGYTKKSGAYIAPHMRTKSNKSAADNYGSKGNVNPYTGQKGSKDPYAPKN